MENLTIKQKVMLAFVLANLMVWATVILVQVNISDIKKEAAVIEVQGFALSLITKDMSESLSVELKGHGKEGLSKNEDMGKLIRKAEQNIIDQDLLAVLQKMETQWKEYREERNEGKRRIQLIAINDTFYEFQSLRLEQTEDWISSSVTALNRKVLIVLILAFLITIALGLTVPKAFDYEKRKG